MLEGLGRGRNARLTPHLSDVTTRAWACGEPGHYHRKKDEADGCIRKRDVCFRCGSTGTASRGAARRTDAVNDSNVAAFANSLRGAGGAERWATADELAKVQGQSSELVKLVTELSAVVGHIAKQVNDIAHTPLPAQTIAYPHGLTGVSKNEDSGRGTPPASDEDIVDRFAKLSPTEQTMLLIKAAYRNPMRPGGIGQADADAT